MNNLKRILSILSKKEKVKLLILIIIILISSIIETLGVASIVPFIALLSNQNLMENNILINKIYIFFNFNNHQIFLFYLGIFFFLFFLLTNIFKAISIYLQLRFCFMLENTIGKRLLEIYLYQPYTWFLNRNSNDLAKNILSEVTLFVNQALLPMIVLISQATIIFFILILLIFVDPKLSFIICLLFFVIYGVIFKFFSNKLNHIGLIRNKNNQERYRSISDAFSAIKETKIRSLENFHLENFSDPSKNYAKHQASVQIISILPRYMFEAIAFGGMLLIILYLMRQSENFISALPVLSLYIFAGYRLMPAFQQSYSSLTSLRFSNDIINSLVKEISLKPNINFVKNKLDFQKNIILKNITYFYPESKKNNLSNISLNVFAKSKIGIVGATGSGKSTLIDIILGLLEPQHGVLSVDNTVISKINVSSWQSIIGYVPQQIFLLDQNISTNIAFGVNSKLINQEFVEDAAKIANLHNFVINELPEKYETVVGEGGIRLSGGQRQRIGIARAIYHKPRILILDEATNALDSLTEKAVMDALDNLNNQITTIIVTHRLSTIQKCDQIFLMDKGKIVATGNYNQLSKDNIEFIKFTSQKK
jgi:ABC-type multidrug transport system fused ATPase/permease subunit